MKRDPDYLHFRPYRAIVATPKKRFKLALVRGKSGLHGLHTDNAGPVRPRNRLLYAVLSAVVIAIGLLWRSSFVTLPPLVAKYGGSAWWSLLVFLGIGFLIPRSKTWLVAFLALIFSFGIEFSQLYEGSWLDYLRSMRLGALILGNTFNWPDLPAYALGILTGATLEGILWKRHGDDDSQFA